MVKRLLESWVDRTEICLQSIAELSLTLLMFSNYFALPFFDRRFKMSMFPHNPLPLFAEGITRLEE